MKITSCASRFWNYWRPELLVLARKINESIMIGDDIEVVVVDIKGDQVKLGIRAPRNVAIHRTEIYQEIQEQNKQAAQSAAPDQVRDLRKLLGKEKKSEEEEGCEVVQSLASNVCASWPFWHLGCKSVLRACGPILPTRPTSARPSSESPIGASFRIFCLNPSKTEMPSPFC